jgi:hypothetical protein
MAEVIRIEVPLLPPSEVSPNARAYWADKYKAGKVYHDAIFYYCVDARNRGFGQGLSFPLIKARLTLTFVFAEERQRDRDNLLASFKNGLDGIVDSGLVLDDTSEYLEIGEINIEVDPARAPMTIIELEELIWSCLNDSERI